ncbi:ABC transporter ATP-binding protein [Modestobacter sp. Leaf380]|uniref:ABC transporter ATP-binding protein n=1 Tax=Modestobacter sp. Leaf380 TaxID=1736356 RepID=UPI0006FBAF0E|nr:ABC transporter ATP-binding protein [Modestobacter sp. Leaf380]KQS71908.1 ABC transporter ATP-binding protein [Modestobacter sp. Leaf380]
MTAAATLDDVTMRFRGHTALDGITTELRQDCITGLLGRNGAGKTTLMQLLTGHRVPTSGRVRVFGVDPYEADSVLQRVCFVKESQRYPDHFRVCDVLTAARMLYPDWDDDLATQLVGEFDLPRRRAVKKLSRGMTSMVGIVVGLASRAPITFFDEPYLGLDAVARQQFYDRLIADWSEQPRTIVLSTHLIEEIGDLLEHVLLVDRGRVLLDEDAESLRDRALTVSGQIPAVAAFTAGRRVLHSDALGSFTRAVVEVHSATDRDEASRHGLTPEPTSLQQLVVALSRATAPTTTAPDDLEGVSR